MGQIGCFHGWWIIPIVFCGIMMMLSIFRMNGYRHCFPDTKKSQHNFRNSGNNENAQSILDNRYARGDISKAEYEQIKADIAGAN
jgi:uncharacterized membrane protein